MSLLSAPVTRYNQEEDKCINQYGDEHFGGYPSAINFFNVLRKRCNDVHPNMSRYVTFMSYSNHGIEEDALFYVRGTSMYEIIISIIYCYICNIEGIINLEFKIPRFSVECVKFQLSPKYEQWWQPDADFDKLLPSADVFQQCVLERLIVYHQNVVKLPYVKPNYAYKYLPTILVCSRYNVCEDAEDIIHQFLGNKMINRYRYVSNESKTIAHNACIESGNSIEKISEHFRVWKSINRIIWDL